MCTVCIFIKTFESTGMYVYNSNSLFKQVSWPDLLPDSPAVEDESCEN